MTVNWKLGETLVLKATEKAIQKLTEMMTKRIIELTPVGGAPTSPHDPHPGQLKASWTSSYDSTKQEGTIYNPQPYAYRIEFGWSAQAPQGMVRVAMKEFNGMLTYAAKQSKI